MTVSPPLSPLVICTRPSVVNSRLDLDLLRLAVFDDHDRGCALRCLEHSWCGDHDSVVDRSGEHLQCNGRAGAKSPVGIWSFDPDFDGRAVGIERGTDQRDFPVNFNIARAS